MLLVFLPVWMVILSTNIFGTLDIKTFNILEQYNQSSCVEELCMMFSYNPWWCCLVTLFGYKFCIYPCIRKKLPSILKRLGFYLLLLSFSVCAYSIISYFFNLSAWPHIAYRCVSSSLYSLIMTTSMEFVCAQSPYVIRGLLSGVNFCVIILSSTLGVLVYRNSVHLCHSKQCLIIPYSIGTGLGMVGFLLYLIVAYWYKRRVRDEEYIPYPHIADIYERYLSQVQESRSSDRLNVAPE